MKKLIALALACMMLVGMTACGGSSKNKLVLSTYGLSEDISAEEVYGPFEEQADCEIVTETGTTNERYTKLSANANAGIDVIELSQALTAQGADEGLFAELDLSKIPNAENLIAPAKELAENGQGIAYTINSVGIVYDREACGMEITSFDDLWDAALEGKIAIPDITTTLTYGDTAANARVLDFTFVNAQLESWIDQWNRTLNS